MSPNEDKPAVGQQPDKENQVQVCESGPERLHAINDLLEVGRLMSYRRLIQVPVFIDPGVQAWTIYATSPACSTSDANARGADQTRRDRVDRVRSTLVQVGSRGRPVMVGRVL